MNAHYETAAHLLQVENGNGGSFIDPNTQNMMTAAAEATLALAYEQRTANLIALESLLQASGAAVEVDAIQVRLGLT